MKIYIADFVSRPMDITSNFDKALEQLDRCAAEGCSVIVYPTACLLGAPLGILNAAQWLYGSYNEKINSLAEKAEPLGIAVVADVINPGTGSFCPVIFTGGKAEKAVNINGFTAKTVNSSSEFFCNAADICSGTDLVFVNWLEKGVAGQKHLWLKALEDISRSCGTAFVLNTAGKGYTTHPHFYMPMTGSVKNGCAEVNCSTAAAQPLIFEAEKTQLTELKADRCCYSRAVSFPVCYSTNPLIPANVPEKEYCLDLFSLQSASLANRLANINCKNIVLNLSGGLDSTMALLVCVKAFDMLGLDKKGLHIVTMPGFGTSKTTKNLAADLCKGFGLSLETIDITQTCTEALLSIGHDGVTPDVTFENVQARTRTMNALNMANHLNAIMVGTGDLSEVALGFSTYGGDQLASYNVNCCVSKTVMRTMLYHLVEEEMFRCVKDAVIGVLTIPVSPELVPHGGEILQKTEEILAPYKLIDFFIYCTVVTKDSPKATADLAFKAFGGEFSVEYIAEKLKMFYRRFATGQFKRSCAPECADITHTSLIGAAKAFASDGSSNVFSHML